MEKEVENFLIENQDLIGGINAALSRGQTLRQAMMSMYNAGYEKVKIEEAARAYIELSRNPAKAQAQTKQIAKKIERKKNSKEKLEKKKLLDKVLESKVPSSKVVPGAALVTDKIVKDASRYGAKPKKVSKAHDNSNVITFLLIFILVFLLLILGSVFLFKNELVDFFNRLFG